MSTKPRYALPVETGVACFYCGKPAVLKELFLEPCAAGAVVRAIRPMCEACAERSVHTDSESN